MAVCTMHSQNAYFRSGFRIIMVNYYVRSNSKENMDLVSTSAQTINKTWFISHITFAGFKASFKW